MLTNVTIHWLANTGASTAGFSHEAHPPTAPATGPLGLANFANDFQASRRFAGRDHAGIRGFFRSLR